MEKNYPHTIDLMKATFWRIAASLIGFAVRRKRIFERILTYTPFVIAGAVAYMLGRLLGELLL